MQWSRGSARDRCRTTGDDLDGAENEVIPNFLMRKSREGLEAWKASWQAGVQGVTRPEYIAVMSAWCCAELTLTAPDTILGMVHRVSVSKNLEALTQDFWLRLRNHPMEIL